MLVYFFVQTTELVGEEIAQPPHYKKVCVLLTSIFLHILAEETRQRRKKKRMHTHFHVFASPFNEDFTL